MKKYKMINGVKHKVIGYTYDGKPLGWIACRKKEIKSVYLTIRINYESDGRINDTEEEKEYVSNMVAEQVNSHSHTIENGIQIQDVEICGYNEV